MPPNVELEKAGEPAIRPILLNPAPEPDPSGPPLPIVSALQADPSDSGHDPLQTVITEQAFVTGELSGYEIAGKLERGGQGVVYRGFEKKTRRPVALKFLRDGPASKSAKYRFAREAAIIARLRHPHIVSFYASGEDEGRQFFAMEFVDGCAIDEYIRDQKLSIDQTVQLMALVCDAISAAHQRGVLHRDLKPSNIMVDKSGQPRILDFGLAKCTDDDETRLLSVSGQVLGTLPYLSPEQARGAIDDLDVRSDVYTLGVILYRLLTGAYPYPVTGDDAVVRVNIRSRPPRPMNEAAQSPDFAVRRSDEWIPQDLETVVLRALAKEPERRYQSADALAADLQRYLKGEAVQARTDSAWYTIRKTLARYRVQTAVAAAFVLLLAGSSIGMGILWKRSRANEARANEIASQAQAGLQMGSFLKVAELKSREGNVDEAIAMIEKAIEIAALGPKPDMAMRTYLCDAHMQIAWLYYGMAKGAGISKAEPHVDESVRLARAVGAYSSNSVRRRYLANVLRLEGFKFLKQKQFEKALPAFEESIEIFESLVRAEPDARQLALEFLRALMDGGDCREKLRQLDAADARYQRAECVLSDLQKEDPNNTRLELNYLKLASHRGGLQMWYKDYGHYKRATEILAEAKSRLDRLAASPEGPSVQRDLWIFDRSISPNLATASAWESQVRIFGELYDRAPIAGPDGYLPYKPKHH